MRHVSRMTTFRIALANLCFPATPDDSVRRATHAIAQAGERGAGLLCFPECYVPGYRAQGKGVPAPDAAFLDAAWSTIAEAARRAGVAVVLGTERIIGGAPMATALVVNPDGTIAGFQDKVQVDPSEDPIYTPGSERRVFTVGPLTFGVVISRDM